VCSDRVIDTVIAPLLYVEEGEARPVEPRRFTFESDHVPVGIIPAAPNCDSPGIPIADCT
jgi:hypothetical protein